MVILTAHIEGTTGRIAQKFKKIAAASTTAGGAPQGVCKPCKKSTSNTKNGVALSWAASHKRGVEGAHVGADRP